MEWNNAKSAENWMQGLSLDILSVLLLDKTTKKNIIWATNGYAAQGEGFAFSDEITIEAITGRNRSVLKPRNKKTSEEQDSRSKDKAEIFTPSWICNKQNNLVDAAWFGRNDVFNREIDYGWITTTEKVAFSDEKGKTWQDYVKARRLEVSCGEAPYLCSRYDTVSGVMLPVKDRIGFLDRKLRVVSENTESEPDWVFWAKKAVQSTYGYEWQGDNVLLARKNILFTFAEHYYEKFGVAPSDRYLLMVAKIAAWNIWQMDGIRFVIPNSCRVPEEQQFCLFEEIPEGACRGCLKNDHSCHNGIYCRTYDWSANRSVLFYSLVKKGAKA